MNAYIIGLNDSEACSESTQSLRRNAVQFAREQLAQGRADVDHLMAFFHNEPDLDAALSELEAEGEYAQNVADLMLQMISSYTGRPLILLNLSNQNVEYIFPETTFTGQIRSNIPVVFLRRGDHFESLIVPQDARANLNILLSTERIKRQGDRGAELLRLQNSESIGPPMHCSTQNFNQTQNSSRNISNFNNSMFTQDPTEYVELINKVVFEQGLGRRQKLFEEISSKEGAILIGLWNTLDPILERLPEYMNTRNQLNSRLEAVIHDYFREKDHLDITEKYKKKIMK